MEKKWSRKREIALVHRAPVGNVHFAGGGSRAAGYVKDRERQCTCSTVCTCKGDSP